MGPGVIIDVTATVKKDPDYRVTVKDLNDWEGKYGTIPYEAVVIMRSGWHERHQDRNRVFNTETPEDTSTFHFPGWL